MLLTLLLSQTVTPSQITPPSSVTYFIDGPYLHVFQFPHFTLNPFHTSPFTSPSPSTSLLHRIISCPSHPPPRTLTYTDSCIGPTWINTNKRPIRIVDRVLPSFCCPSHWRSLITPLYPVYAQHIALALYNCIKLD